MEAHRMGKRKQAAPLSTPATPATPATPLADFAIFILSHGRPDNIHTLKTLERANYSGRYFIVIDNEDKTADQYVANYGDKVLIFDKAGIAATFDEGDNFGDRRAVIYARNACFALARSLGIRYFMELDDDYFTLCYRTDDNFNYVDSVYATHVLCADEVLAALLEYFKSIPVASLAIAQSGDFLGGKQGGIETSINRRRKAMNTFICDTERPFTFVGRVNEDVNTYTAVQNRGAVFITFPLLAIQQKQTQHNRGGMTEMYLDSGTYVKSFYTVMYLPSAVKVKMMGEKHRRLHHSIDWDAAVPVIIPERFRKARPASGATS